VVIDTPPTFDALLKNALEVADAVVIPFVPHHLGVIAVGQMVRAIYQNASANGQNTPHVGILPVMVNPHIPEHREAIAKVKIQFGEEKFFSPIGIDVKLSNQFEGGNPIIENHQRSRGIKDYQSFVEELLTRL
jgi:chromosome partitioning protein